MNSIQNEISVQVGNTNIFC